MAIVTISAFVFALDSQSAGYNVSVVPAPGALYNLRSIAVGTVICPRHKDCLWLERKLEKLLRGYHRFKVVGADRVREAMHQAGIDRLDEASRGPLAERLAVDAFLQPVVGQVVETTPGVSAGPGFPLPDEYGHDIDWLTTYKADVELLLVGGADGKVLLKGYGFGESLLKSKRGVVLGTFREILSEVFGDASRKPNNNVE